MILSIAKLDIHLKFAGQNTVVGQCSTLMSRFAQKANHRAGVNVRPVNSPCLRRHSVGGYRESRPTRENNRDIQQPAITRAGIFSLADEKIIKKKTKNEAARISHRNNSLAL